MDVIKYRKENPSDRKDLLSAMLEGVDSKTRQKMTDKSITDNLSQSPSPFPTMVQSIIYIYIYERLTSAIVHSHFPDCRPRDNGRNIVLCVLQPTKEPRDVPQGTAGSRRGRWRGAHHL